MDLATLLELLGVVFAIGGTSALVLYRLRNVERIAKKAHKRIDQLVGTREWIETGVLEDDEDQR